MSRGLSAGLRILTCGTLLAVSGCSLVNSPPLSLFTVSVTDGAAPLFVEFDASLSRDSDGSIASYSWDFGDGETSIRTASEATPERDQHTYPSAGRFVVTLSVVDDDGALATSSVQIGVSAPQEPPPGSHRPVASFETSPASGRTPLLVQFDASESTDEDGRIVLYSWNFGDGATGQGRQVAHTYTSAGTFIAELAVADDQGETDSTSRAIRVLGDGVSNRLPVATFEASPASGHAPLVVRFDGSESTDEDGTIVVYSWDFGDGGTGSGAALTHTYNTSGIYTSTLTVKDDGGATSCTTRQIEVTAPPIRQDLYVSARAGSDAAGDGSDGNPYRTITKAVSVADPEGGTCTIHLAAGVYDAALGEVFPLDLGSVNLVGQGASRDDAKIVGRITASASTISRISSYSLMALGASCVLTDCTLDSSDGSGSPLFIGGPSEVRGCLIRGTDVGVEAACRIVGNEFYSNLSIGYYGTGGQVHVEGNTLHLLTAGLSIYGSGMVIVRGNTLLGGGISVAGLASAVIEGNRIEDGPYDGIIISHSAVADLGGGPLNSAGGNVIAGNGGYNIHDNRIPYSGPLYAKGNTWGNPQLLGVVAGPTISAPDYAISNEGNSVVFSD